jgi:hypothetical protein
MYDVTIRIGELEFRMDSHDGLMYRRSEDGAEWDNPDWDEMWDAEGVRIANAAFDALELLGKLGIH